MGLVTRSIEERSALLPAERIVEEAAFDKYAYIRDAVLQKRQTEEEKKIRDADNQ